jgi:flagellin
MPQIINTNIASLNAQRNLNKSQSANQTALQRLSSGLRINSAKDDAAGLAISTRFNSQIRGLNVAVRNAGDGISLAQTAEGALGSMSDNLQRVRELAVQSANATNSDVDREALQAEVTQLLSEVSRTAEETDFNGRKLLDGSFSATFQIGANAGQTLDISIAELTAGKLGASKDSGISAQGNSNALGNGDLSINGVAIQASRAEDDTASTSNSAASAIAKVEAINRAYDETGVKAQVTDNVASGSSMTALAGTGTISINNVSIDITTTSDATQTRAGVVEAINAAAEQTGVMAVNSETDAGGVKLVAADGRNIQISFDTASFTNLTAANFAAATGLAGGQEVVSGTEYSATYEGGYTLIADSDVSEIKIEGGNGTGRGDLANAGLTEGTYTPGQASMVTTKVSDNTSATVMATGGSNYQAAARTDAGGTIVSGTGTANIVQAAAPVTGTDAEVVVDVNGVSALATIANGQTIAEAAFTLNGVAGIDVSERIEFKIDDYTTAASTSDTLTFTDAGGNTLAISLPDSATNDFDGDGDFDAQDRLGSLADAINSATWGVSTNTISAQLDAAGTGLDVVIINNGNGAVSAVAGDAGTTVTINGTGNLTNVAADFSGELQVTKTTASDNVTMATSTNAGAFTGVELASANNTVDVIGGSNSQGAAAQTALTVTVDGVDVSPAAVPRDSTVADVAASLDGVTGISAWEEVSFSVLKEAAVAGNDLNATVGDTFNIGGVAVAITADSADTDAVYLQSLADDINGADFSGVEMQVNAVVKYDGTSNYLDVTVNNFSGNDVTLSTDAQSRRLSLDVSQDAAATAVIDTVTGSAGNAIQLGGSLQYVSDDGLDVSVTVSDPTGGGEIIASGNASESSSFTGVNGLQDGDMSINGVSIGSAQAADDTASATVSSDGFRILSSEKSLSGIAMVNAINAVSEETGVTATVNSTKVVGGDGSTLEDDINLSTDFETGDQAGLYINGVNLGSVTLQGDSAGVIDSDRAKADAINLINQNSGKTGVTAIDNGVSISLEAADGRNISIAIDDRSGSEKSIGAVFGLDADTVKGIGESTFGDTSNIAANAVSSAESRTYETTYSTIQLNSAKEINIDIGTKGAEELASLGLTAGTFGGGESGQFLEDIDISTFEGATAALTAIDNAIGAIASQRADLGAIQNRIESTVSNLAITSENLSAANSRIQDADFAAETAELSRTQVLQQAGISILAQANQGPQQVLSLLG